MPLANEVAKSLRQIEAGGAEIWSPLVADCIETASGQKIYKYDLEGPKSIHFRHYAVSSLFFCIGIRHAIYDFHISGNDD